LTFVAICHTFTPLPLPGCAGWVLAGDCPVKDLSMPPFTDVTVPANGQTITISHGKLNVPDHPILPFIEGDGTGPDICIGARTVTYDFARQMEGAKEIKCREFAT
jgi:hypothetical protein